MKKCFYLLLALLAFSFSNANAAPGDTTWVQAHNDKWLDYYNDFDSTVTFPDGSVSYRRIYMIFTLGKYQCPGNPQYCGDWDYTIQNFLMTPGGDTLEIARLISPYANASMPRTPWTWKERYVFDVTDYYKVLKNSATMRLHYSGYSGGFTANIKFAFVEGTRDRDVVGMDRLWHGNFPYGSAGNDIENYLPELQKTAPAGTQSAEMKFTITGHGSDANNCGEFCQKYYDVLLNNANIDQKSIWRDNCGFNHLYAQSGTWIYDRANWCPGDLVHVNSHPLSGLTAGAYSLNVNMEPYAANGGAVETIESVVFYYGAFNKNVDASLDDIIAPTNNEAHYRENNMCGQPTIHVKNTGGTAITSLKIKYGLAAAPGTFTWNGNLASTAETDIVLPELPSLNQVSLDSVLSTQAFTAEIEEVNGAADNDLTNNKMTSYYTPAPKWPNSFVVSLKTNHDLGTSWKIVDMNNNIYAQRINTTASTFYADTVTLGGAGCYKLVVEDAGCDGLYFFDGSNTGTLQVAKNLTQPIPVYLTLRGYANGNFGCGFTQYFATKGFPAGIENISETPIAIEAYPNPANATLNIGITGVQNVQGSIRMIDALGRLVLETACTGPLQRLDVSGLANGLYTLIFIDSKKADHKIQTRVTIAK